MGDDQVGSVLIFPVGWLAKTCLDFMKPFIAVDTRFQASTLDPEACTLILEP